jgi:acetyltransferase
MDRPSTLHFGSDARHHARYQAGRWQHRGPVDQWLLPNGRHVQMRRLGPDDTDLESAFLQALSPESRYQRFMSARQLSTTELQHLIGSEPDCELVLMATTRINGTERPLGMAHCVIDDSGKRAEVAVVVADAWQGMGVGERLTRNLIRLAANTGVRTLTAITFSTNARLIKLARKLDFQSRPEPGDSTVTRLTRRLSLPAIAIAE